MVHTKDSIQELLRTRDDAVIRAVLAIQKRQTADEQAGHTTRHTNGVGWSKLDAAWMASMIQSFNRWNRLTPKQMAITRRKVMRYHRQLVEIANEREQRLQAQRALAERIAEKTAYAHAEMLAERRAMMAEET